MSSDTNNFINTERILNLAYDRENNAIVVRLGPGSVSIDLKPGDIQIGAVELKDATTEYRAIIDALGRLATLVDYLPSVGGEPYRVTVTDVPVVLLVENANRKKYFIQNLSEDNGIFIGKSGVSSSTGISVSAFGAFGDEMPYCGKEAIYAVANSGESAVVVVKEWE